MLTSSTSPHIRPRPQGITWAMPPMAAALPEAPSGRPFAREAQQLVTWLRSQRLILPDSTGRLYLIPWLDVMVDDDVSAERQAAMLDACAWLTPSTARKLTAFFIERAHAERTDIKAVQNGLEHQMARLLEQLHHKRPLVSARVPVDAPHLLNLRAPHYDGCLFDPTNPVDRGGQGIFYVGITTHKHAVAVKRMMEAKDGRQVASQAAFDREAAATRRASRFDVLQLYSSSRHQYMVMPLFNGDLRQHAQVFLSLYDPPGTAASQGLFGARYVLRQLVEEVAFLHNKRQLMHQDIKPANIFVQRDRKRLVLGDLGMASTIGQDGQARFRGYTPNLAAPEQFGNAAFIGPKVDVFGLAATLFELLTTRCPPVVAYRRKHFPQQSDAGLFFCIDEVPRMHAAHRDMMFAALDGSHLAEATEQQPNTADWPRAHFASIHKSVDHFDAPLGDLLRCMLQHDPLRRPSANRAMVWMDTHMALDSARKMRIDAAWTRGVPRYSEPVRARLQTLHAAMDTLSITAHAAAQS